MQLLPDPPGQAQTQPAKPTRFAGGLRSDVCRNRFLRFRPIDNGAIAQLGERLVCNQKVAGSIPISSTNLKPELSEEWFHVNHRSLISMRLVAE